MPWGHRTQAVTIILRWPHHFLSTVSTDARDVAQRRRWPRLQSLWLLPAAERRHAAGLLHHAADCHLWAPHPSGPGLLTQSSTTARDHFQSASSVAFAVVIYTEDVMKVFFSCRGPSTLLQHNFQPYYPSPTGDSQAEHHLLCVKLSKFSGPRF